MNRYTAQLYCCIYTVVYVLFSYTCFGNAKCAFVMPVKLIDLNRILRERERERERERDREREARFRYHVSRLIHTYSVCSAFAMRIFCRTHVKGSEHSHCTRLRSGSGFQERCGCSSAAIVSAQSLFCCAACAELK